MSRYLCIHGHFYQPPRENPWLEKIEQQDSAYPFHDWNDRITAECYAPNASARILDGDAYIRTIVSNYDKISFNFGPTLLSWMQEHRPDCYEAILKSDEESRKRYNGHGSALAQVYNHMIMPLANSRDKRTQVIWGIRDFEHRFKRKPEGMWLAETAVDLETLEILVDHGIRFTLLAPRQASKVRRMGEEQWHDVSESRIDPRRPYRCPLPSGRSIDLFFYDGNVSQDVAFAGLLKSGERFAGRLVDAFTNDWDSGQLVHIATDGETYGHHSAYGDMALAYCLYYIEQNDLAKLTIYGEFLDLFPPGFEVEIFENSSWSCVHGVDRWKENCGCNSGGNGGWHQKWRKPLREALDELRDRLITLFEQEGAGIFKDPWAARNAFIDVILDRTSLEAFEESLFHPHLSDKLKVKGRKLLESQRNAMLMYTSCGWFFDEISGIEPVQIMQYAARAIQLAEEITDEPWETDFIKKLAEAPSNNPEFKNGADVYEKWVRPSRSDLLRIAAHYAVGALFEKYPTKNRLFCYSFQSERQERLELGKNRISFGKALMQSEITGEECEISFAALHLGDHNITAGVHQSMGLDQYQAMVREIKESFRRADIPQIVRLIDKHFGTCTYTLWQLFKDTQVSILRRELDFTSLEMESVFQRTYHDHRILMNVLKGASLRMPAVFATTVEFLANAKIRRALESEHPDLLELATTWDEFAPWGPQLDTQVLLFLARNRVHALMKQVCENIGHLDHLTYLVQFLRLLKRIGFKPDYWQAQNLYFHFSRERTQAYRETAAAGDPQTQAWMEQFLALGELLSVHG